MTPQQFWAEFKEMTLSQQEFCIGVFLGGLKKVGTRLEPMLDETVKKAKAEA